MCSCEHAKGIRKKWCKWPLKRARDKVDTGSSGAEPGFRESGQAKAEAKHPAQNMKETANNFSLSGILVKGDSEM